MRPWPVNMRKGTKVEVRPHNRDELFYSATIVGRNTTRLPYTFNVIYKDDGVYEEGLFLSSILVGQSRSVVFSDACLVAEDGTILLRDGSLRRLRLMHFQHSFGVYQSGLLLKCNGIEPDFGTLPFEVNQAMLLGVYFVRQCEQQRICVLGLGGGAIPSCLEHSQEFAQVHVVENTPQVVECCRKHFFLSDCVAVHLQDAVEFLIECNARNSHELDCIIVDVANESNECPSPQVIEFFATRIRSKADENIVYVINALVEQATDTLTAIKRYGGCVHCFQIGTTNRVFVLSPEEQQRTTTRLELIDRIQQSFPKLRETMQGIIEQLTDDEEECWRGV